MSKKFKQKLLTDMQNATPTKFKSKFGESILKKYGWTEGQGLGANQNGIVEPLIINKRDENMGLGCKKKSNWSNWWDGMYDDVAKKLNGQMQDFTVASDTKNVENNSLTLPKKDEERVSPKEKRKKKSKKQMKPINRKP